jgi:hypothetical protein
MALSWNKGWWLASDVRMLTILATASHRGVGVLLVSTVKEALARRRAFT